MNVYLQILKVNDIREGVGKLSGQPYRMQDAECVILTEAGEVDEVGVLMLGKDQVGVTQPGIYVGSFAMRADKSKEGQRRIGAVLTGLRQVKKSGAGFVPVEAPKVA
jgi:hypothetical protein